MCLLFELFPYSLLIIILRYIIHLNYILYIPRHGDFQIVITKQTSVLFVCRPGVTGRGFHLQIYLIHHLLSTDLSKDTHPHIYALFFLSSFFCRKTIIFFLAVQQSY